MFQVQVGIHRQSVEMAFPRMALRPRFSIASLLLMTTFIAFFAELIRRKHREEVSRSLLGAYSIGDSLDQDLLDLALGFEGRTKHIDIGRVSQDCIDLRLLRDFPKLETVSFSNSSTVLFNDELVFVDIQELSYWDCSAELIRKTIPCFPNVESLLVCNTLGSGIVLDDDLDLISIRNCKRLKRIDIVHDGITGSFLEALPKLGLEKLRLESNLIRRDVLHSLIRFKNFAELELRNSGKRPPAPVGGRAARG